MGSRSKRIIRLIWNGPFHIGKLSPPVSVGDALLKVLETAWRLFLVAISLLIAIGLSLAAWIYVIEPIFFPPLKDQISVKVTFDDGSGPPPIIARSVGGEPRKPFRCSADFPLKIEFTNESSETIGRIGFSIEGYAPARSRNLVQNGGWREADAVIPAGYKGQACWSVELEDGSEPNELTYHVEIISADRADRERKGVENPHIPLPTRSPSETSETKSTSPTPTQQPRLTLATLGDSDWEKIGMGCSCTFTVGIPRQEKLISGGDGLTFFRLNGKEFLCAAPDIQAMFDGAVSMSCGSAALQVTPFGEIEPGFDGNSSKARLNVASPSGQVTLTGTWGCGC